MNSDSNFISSSNMFEPIEPPTKKKENLTKDLIEEYRKLYEQFINVSKILEKNTSEIMLLKSYSKLYTELIGTLLNIVIDKHGISREELMKEFKTANGYDIDNRLINDLYEGDTQDE